jgi:hypothetical protein
MVRHASPYLQDRPGDSSNPPSPQKSLGKEKKSKHTKESQSKGQSVSADVYGLVFLVDSPFSSGNTPKLLLQLVAGDDAPDGGEPMLDLQLQLWATITCALVPDHHLRKS